MCSFIKCLSLEIDATSSVMHWGLSRLCVAQAVFFDFIVASSYEWFPCARFAVIVVEGVNTGLPNVDKP